MEYLVKAGSGFIRDKFDVKISDLSPKIPLIGIPWDWSTGGKPGARFAPQSIRNALYSMRNSAYSFEELNIGFNDLGDVKIVSGDEKETSRRIREVSSNLYKINHLPVVFLGGDHSITKNTLYPLTEIHNSIGLFIFDAHYDLREVEEGLTSGSWLNELMKEKNNKISAMIIGISDYSNPSYMKDKAEKYKIKVFPRDFLLNDTSKLYYEIEAIKHNVNGIYISIDMDHIDQSFAPGVNSPTALGMYPHETIKLLNKILENANLFGIDVTEVSPPYDINNNTSRLGAKFLLYALNYYLQGKQNFK
ncbi:MAG: arginase family protein [Caldisphaera sp.]|jgi:agmatinase|nr:arginase family protein [Caldisphaera sp.]PMP91707.1 MAG: hypothetical protein C0171_02170 [Caldisphaera sp.]